MDIELLYKNHISKNNRRVSTAIGLPTAKWLIKKLDELKPHRILDLGSGFSTTVFRYWNKNGNSIVYTVDTHEKWLNTTEVELQELRLNVSNLWIADKFNEVIGDIKFDFVFIDIDKTKYRLDNIDLYMNLAEKGALIIFDDWHLQHFSLPMTKYLLTLDYGIQEILETKDEFGRYEATIIKK